MIVDACQEKHPAAPVAHEDHEAPRPVEASYFCESHVLQRNALGKKDSLRVYNILLVAKAAKAASSQILLVVPLREMSVTG